MLVHSIYQSALKKTSLEPDTEDPNNSCRTCQKKYSSRRGYRRHLRLIHQMKLALLPAKINDESRPGPDDATYYCDVCKKSWVERVGYRAHCRNVHYKILGYYCISNPSAIIDINHPKFYCAQCEHSYCNKQGFKSHLKKIHCA